MSEKVALHEETGAAFVVDDEGSIVEANDSCVVVFELVLDDLVGRRVESLADEGFFADGFFQEFRAALGGDGERTFRAGIRSAGEDDPHTYEVEVTPTDGGAVCTLSDVGTRFRYEETVDRLNGITRELIAADSRVEVLSAVGDAANEVLGFPGVGVRIYDPQDELLRHVSFGGVVNEIDARPPYDVDDSPHGRAFRRDETVVEEIPDDGDPYDREVFSHTMYVPIGDYGVLSLGRVGSPFDRADVHFAEILADNARAALQQVEQKERLRDQRRRLEERNERLDEFASVVSHDLRNPLSVAKGSVEAYRGTGDDEFVDDVEYALDRMDDIIDEMLELAREGASPGDVERVSLAATARAAWRNVETGDVELVVEEDYDFEVDPDRIQRLFENLFRNSVEHGSTGSRAKPDDSVEHGSTGSQTQPGDSVEHGSTGSRAKPDDSAEHGSTVSAVTVGPVAEGFFVADDGVGIDPEERDAVFESGYTDAEDGTGYGLAIVARIADEHGFDVAVTDGEAGGARFEFTGVGIPD